MESIVKYSSILDKALEISMSSLKRLDKIKDDFDLRREGSKSRAISNILKSIGLKLIIDNNFKRNVVSVQGKRIKKLLPRKPKK